MACGGEVNELRCESEIARGSECDFVEILQQELKLSSREVEKGWMRK
jgi:hypothetical protein